MAKQYSEPPAFALDLDKSYTATLDTNHGTIEIELDPGRSPIAVNNFATVGADVHGRSYLLQTGRV